MTPAAVRCWLMVGAILVGTCPSVADDRPAAGKGKAKPAVDGGGANAAEVEAFKDADPKDFQDPHHQGFDRPGTDRVPGAVRAAKDPVVSAFELPRGVIPRPDQIKRLQELRKKYEPILRNAISGVTSGSDDTSKASSAKDAKRIREEIQAEILAILSSPPPAKPGSGGQANHGKQKPHNDKGHQNKPHHAAAKPPAKHVDKAPAAKHVENKPKKPANKPPAKPVAKADSQKKK